MKKFKAIWNNIFLFLLTCAFFGAQTTALSQNIDRIFYVRPHDTLSFIAGCLVGSPIYSSKNGTLKEIKDLNPQLKDPDTIFIGQKIVIPSPRNNISETMASKCQTAFPGMAVASTSKISNINRQIASVPEDNVGSQSDSSNPSVTEGPKPKEYSSIIPQLGGWQSALRSTDRSSGGKSVLGSNFSPEFKLKWSQNWENNFETFLSSSVKREDFSTTSATKTVTKGDPILFGFDIGAKALTLGDYSKLYLSLGLAQTPVARTTTGSDIVIDAVSAPKAEVITELGLLKTETFKLSTILKSAYLYPYSKDTYKTKHGFTLGGGIYLQQDISSLPLLAGIDYNFTKQDTTISKQNYTSVGVSFGLQFDYYKVKKVNAK